MSDGKITINVSGGDPNFATISQGDNNTIESQLNVSAMNQAFTDFFTQLDKLVGSETIPANQITELKNEIVTLQEMIEASQPAQDSLIQIAKVLYEKYGWAADILKKLWAVFT